MAKLDPGLYLVGTPLGNMGDISKRAIETLRDVDVIVCEDTREMKKLLSLIGIERGDRDIVSLHEHNEFEKKSAIVERIKSGESVAYTSDAGMPAISDPGALLVDAIHDAGMSVTCVPGATAVTTAVALSGFDSSGFTFLGFFPRDQKEKKQYIQQIKDSQSILVFYESPKRLAASLKFLSGEVGTDRRVVVARELTKKFEEVFRGSLGQATERFNTEVKGECVVVLEQSKKSIDHDLNEQAIKQALLELQKAGVSSRNACEVLMLVTDLPKNRLKDLYLEQSRLEAT